MAVSGDGDSISQTPQASPFLLAFPKSPLYTEVGTKSPGRQNSRAKILDNALLAGLVTLTMHLQVLRNHT